MPESRTVKINFRVAVSLEKRDDCWAAYMEPLGMTVYGDTREDAENRVQQALDFFIKHFGAGDEGIQRVQSYLDSHSVPNFITEDNEDDGVSPIHRIYPVSIPIETLVSA